MEAPTITEQSVTEVHSAAEAPSKKLALFGLIGLFAVFMVSLLFTLPEGQYFTICGFKNFTGLPCPGCGLTHSFCALGKGEITAAFSFNLLGPPLFFALVLLWIRSGCVLLNKDGSKTTYTVNTFVSNTAYLDSTFKFDKAAHPGVSIIDMRDEEDDSPNDK